MATVQAIEMQVNSNGARSSATALPAHDRKYGVIQNLSTNVLYVKIGAGCTTTDYDFILKASSVALDATGGQATIEENGIVTVAGTSMSYAAFER